MNYIIQPQVVDGCSDSMTELIICHKNKSSYKIVSGNLLLFSPFFFTEIFTNRL